MGARHTPLTVRVDKLIGMRIRAAREALGMSQSGLGDAIGVTFQQVQKYERGINRVSAGRLLQIAQTLSVTMEYFYEDCGAEQGAWDPAAAEEVTTVRKFAFSAEGSAFFKVILAIKRPEERRLLLDFARLLVKRQSLEENTSQSVPDTQ